MGMDSNSSAGSAMNFASTSGYGRGAGGNRTWRSETRRRPQSPYPYAPGGQFGPQGGAAGGNPTGAGPVAGGNAGGGGGGATGGTLAEQLPGYEVPFPSVAEAYLRSFNRGGPIDVPSFQELYGSYRDVAERETGRQAANITEAFGSQGARYSSDLLNAQGRLRENLASNLQNQSGQFLTDLRKQQFTEASALGNLQYGISEAGMTRLFQDFLRRTSPPPLFGQAGGFNPPQPTTVLA